METQENFDEIIFEKRNKDYGAYYHRVVYEKILLQSLFYTSAAIIVVVWFLFSSFKGKEIKKDNGCSITVSLDRPPAIDKTEEKIPLPPPPQKIEKENEAVKPNSEWVATTEEFKDERNPEITEISWPKIKDEGTDFLTIDTTKKIETFIPKTEEIPMVMAPEEPPQFKGGDEKRINFIIDNLKYPKQAREGNLSGRVYIFFIIEKDGSLSNIDVKRGIGGGCDEEALRVTKLMPRWEPGRQNGSAVRVPINMPIEFHLKE